MEFYGLKKITLFCVILFCLNNLFSQNDPNSSAEAQRVIDAKRKTDQKAAKKAQKEAAKAHWDRQSPAARKSIKRNKKKNKKILRIRKKNQKRQQKYSR